MAKSTGNISRVADLVAEGVSPRALRYALIAAHYRMALSFGPDSLHAAASAVERLDAVWTALGAYVSDAPDDPDLDAVLRTARDGFEAGFDDDLNVSPALAAVFDLVRELNRRIAARSLSTDDAARARAVLADLDRVLALLPDEDVLEPELAALVEARAAARERREWAESDRLRAASFSFSANVNETLIVNAVWQLALRMFVPPCPQLC